MDKWSVEDVHKWLIDVVGVPEATAALFKDKEIDGQVLSLLTEDEFKNEFNVSFGQRKKILMLRDDVVCKGKYWTIWVVPLKGVKVGVRNVDPDKDIEELKSKIRDHPELNLTGYILSEFSLRRKGGIELPVGSIVRECLAPGDEVELISYRIDNTKIPPNTATYGTNMYKPHYRPPPLPGSPRERSSSDPGEDLLIPSPAKVPKSPDNLISSLALSFNNHRQAASTSTTNLRTSSSRMSNPSFNSNTSATSNNNNNNTNNNNNNTNNNNNNNNKYLMSPTMGSGSTSVSSSPYGSPVPDSSSVASPGASKESTPTITRHGSNLRISTTNIPQTIQEARETESPFNNALHGHSYLYNSMSSLPSPGATSMASSWENLTNPGSSRSSSPASPKVASPLLPNVPHQSPSGKSSPSNLSGSYGISHSSNEMMANAIVDYNIFMHHTPSSSTGNLRSTSGRRWSTIATPSAPPSSDEPPVAYSYKRRSSVPTPPTLSRMMRRESTASTASMASIAESDEPGTPPDDEDHDTDRDDEFDDADAGLDQALEEDSMRPSHPFYVVGIGASAGGLEALEQFFDNMPNNSGMAFVVVQHLSPNYKSMMVQLLGKHTGMVIKKVEDRMKIEANHIYLLQPSMNIFIEHGLLRVHRQDRSGRAVNLPINLFFKSLGLYFKEKTIGIILSGTGSDGMDGIRSIKEQSGMVMVQNNSAKFDGMPQSAINTGLVDYILSPEQMPAELLRYARFPATVGTLPSDPLISYTQNILDIVYKQTAINFSNYKKATIWRRIEHRMNVNRYDDIEVYIKFLENNHEEVTLLAKDLLIGVTKFFRDHEVWEGMKKRVIPNIVQNCKSGAVRVWVVACSTGEEAYTLAILFQEYKEMSKLEFEIKIYATDIDRDAVEKAGTGYYEEGSLVASLSIERIQKFFVKRGNGYVVTPQLRRMVIFAVQNVISDPPFNKMDLITCRNLLIYFEHQQQKEVLSLFHYSLVPGGFLVLGKSESNLSSSSRFEQFDQKWRIFRNKGGFASWNVENFKPKKYLSNIDSQKKVIAAIAGEARNSGDSESVLQQLCHVWVDEYIPPCFVVDNQGNLHHTFGEVMPFMRISGKATLNILKIVKKELSISLGIAIRRATKEKRSILYKEVHLRELDTFVHVRVFPLPSTDPELLAIFIEKSYQQIHAFKPSDASDHEVVMLKTRLADLEQELEQTKENLQVTVEELETSNEELQSSNEELLAANEELQSTNEELQSVNEELYTVNSENRSKIEELTELNNDMNNLLASTHIGTLFLDRNLNIRKFTTAVSKHIPVMDSDIGRPVKHLSNNSYDFLTEDARIVMQNLTPLEREVCGSDNEWYLMRTLPYHTDHNNVGGVVITFFNISQRKQVEQDLRRAKELAEQAVTAKADFLANMSHEIRTPMNSVKGFAELLISTPLNEEQRQFVNHIHHSGTIMLTLLNDILDFSSLEVGKLVLHPSPCDLVKIAYDVMDVLSLVARDKSLDMVMQIAPELPIIIGDEKRIRQVLLNLMGNAVKFTATGHVILRIDFTMDGPIPIVHSNELISLSAPSSPTDVSTRYARIEFAVEDTGQGVPSDKLNLIFEKFTQLDSKLSRKHDGSGLGLAISRHLLDLMGSTLNVTSEVGKGSTFWFVLSLPLAAEPPEPIGTEASEKRAADATEKRAADLALDGLKIMLLENSMVHRDVIDTYLKYLKCETVTAETEDELYRYLQHYLQLPVDDPHVLGPQRELAMTLPRSASAQSMASLQVRREALARKGSMDSALLNPIIVLVSIKIIKNLSTFRIKLRHIADAAKVHIQTLLLLEAGDLVNLNSYNNIGFSQYIVKPFHVDKLKSHLLKLMDDVPQTLSPVLRPQHPVKAVNKNAAKEGLSIEPTTYLGDPKEMNTIKGMRVLVTEDNQVNQLVAEKMLKRLGCEVVIAKDGYEALEKLQTCKLDLVFMDLHMPGLDGYETTRRIREEEQRTGAQRVPIIALTAKSMSSDRKVCLEANMDDYVSKPHSLVDLKRVLLLFSPNRQANLNSSSGSSNGSNSNTNSPALTSEPLALTRGATKSAPPRTTSPLAHATSSFPPDPLSPVPVISSPPSSPITRKKPPSPSPSSSSSSSSTSSSSAVNSRLQALAISPPLSISPPIPLPQPRSSTPLPESTTSPFSATLHPIPTSPPSSTASSSTSASAFESFSHSATPPPSTSDPNPRPSIPSASTFDSSSTSTRTTISLPRPTRAITPPSHSPPSTSPTPPFESSEPNPTSMSISFPRPSHSTTPPLAVESSPSTSPTTPYESSSAPVPTTHTRTTISLPRPSRAHARTSSGNSLPYALPARQTSPISNELKEASDVPALTLSPASAKRQLAYDARASPAQEEEPETKEQGFGRDKRKEKGKQAVESESSTDGPT